MEKINFYDNSNGYPMTEKRGEGEENRGGNFI